VPIISRYVRRTATSLWDLYPLNLFVLRKFDCGGGLIFRRTAVDFALNGVAQIDQL
jgi:hypothetical protein